MAGHQLRLVSRGQDAHRAAAPQRQVVRRQAVHQQGRGLHVRPGAAQHRDEQVRPAAGRRLGRRVLRGDDHVHQARLHRRLLRARPGGDAARAHLAVGQEPDHVPEREPRRHGRLCPVQVHPAGVRAHRQPALLHAGAAALQDGPVHLLQRQHHPGRRDRGRPARLDRRVHPEHQEDLPGQGPELRGQRHPAGHHVPGAEHGHRADHQAGRPAGDQRRAEPQLHQQHACTTGTRRPPTPRR